MEKIWQKIWRIGRKEKFTVRTFPKLSISCIGKGGSVPFADGFFVRTQRETGRPIFTWFIPSANSDAPLLVYLRGSDNLLPDLTAMAEEYTIAVITSPDCVQGGSGKEPRYYEQSRIADDILDVLCVIRWAFRQKKCKNRIVIVGGNALTLPIAAVCQKYTIACCAIQPCLTVPLGTLMRFSEGLTVPAFVISNDSDGEDVMNTEFQLYRTLPLKGFNRYSVSCDERASFKALTTFLAEIPENTNPMLGKRFDHIPELSKESRSILLEHRWQIKLLFTESTHRAGSSAVSYYIHQQGKAYPERIFECLDEVFADEICVQELIDLLFSYGISAVADWDTPDKICWLFCKEAER